MEELDRVNSGGIIIHLELLVRDLRDCPAAGVWSKGGGAGDVPSDFSVNFQCHHFRFGDWRRDLWRFSLKLLI